jgi:hypothetical protein
MTLLLPALSLFAFPFVSGCPYLSRKLDEDLALPNDHPHTPRQLLRTPPPPPSPPSFSGTTSQAIAAARADVSNMVLNEPFLGPKLVRLAFHDCVGGCNGCVNMAKVDNRGLDEPINKLAGIVNRYRNQLTRADVWMLAAIEAASVLQKGGAVDFEFNFVGRASCPDPFGGIEPAMPSPHLATQGILNFFDNEFGFSSSETVAILGAHTL